jgi:hypothetical protein
MVCLPELRLHRRPVTFLRLIPGLLLILGVVPASASQASPPTQPNFSATKHVLVLYPDNRWFSSQALIDKTLHTDLPTSGQTIELFTEDMERMRLGDPS